MEDSTNAMMLPPSSPLNPRRPQTTQDWEEQREIFEQLYYLNDRPLGEVMQVMELERGFRATYATIQPTMEVKEH
jgi:hypothetical protein